MDEMFTPELLQALSQAGLLPQILDLAQGSIGRGNKMADTPMPQGQVYEPGYQAPHPLEYVSAILRRAQGEKMAAQGTQQAQAGIKQYGDTALDYYQALAAGLRAPQGPSPAGATDQLAAPPWTPPKPPKFI